mmetsp:Transcript_18878/g.56606  ORF Transcript_18878/g.56606 Transcript_18878/m.56606 type:complete len:211 (+) Transcript_18878:206-838(+)
MFMLKVAAAHSTVPPRHPHSSTHNSSSNSNRLWPRIRINTNHNNNAQSPTSRRRFRVCRPKARPPRRSYSTSTTTTRALCSRWSTSWTATPACRARLPSSVRPTCTPVSVRSSSTVRAPSSRTARRPAASGSTTSTRVVNAVPRCTCLRSTCACLHHIPSTTLIVERTLVIQRKMFHVLPLHDLFLLHFRRRSHHAAVTAQQNRLRLAIQ